jgi:hypothetical protein
MPTRWLAFSVLVGPPGLEPGTKGSCLLQLDLPVQSLHLPNTASGLGSVTAYGRLPTQMITS